MRFKTLEQKTSERLVLLKQATKTLQTLTAGELKRFIRVYQPEPPVPNGAV
jgi:hypothetical protein